jgi:hypothetical protein
MIIVAAYKSRSTTHSTIRRETLDNRTMNLTARGEFVLVARPRSG